MKNKKIKILSLISMFSLSMCVPIMALENTVPVVLNVEPMLLDVTVPASLTINVDNRGVVTTADNAKIVNNSLGAIVVSNVTLTGKDSWSVVDFQSDFSGVAVGSKKIGFSINDVQSGVDGGFTWSSQKINGVKGEVKSELPITYNANVPAQKDSINNLNVLDVSFVIGWFE